MFLPSHLGQIRGLRFFLIYDQLGFLLMMKAQSDFARILGV